MAETTAQRPAFASRGGADSAGMDARGPGVCFCDHPGLYALSLAGVEARKAESGRARWWALAGLIAARQSVWQHLADAHELPATATGNDLVSTSRVEGLSLTLTCPPTIDREPLGLIERRP
jgi:hypothetical protein